MSSPSSPTPPQPITLTVAGTLLYQQAIGALISDTDPTQGLMPALGARNGDPKLSVYPNFETDGPSPVRATCPTPFLVVYDAGARALDEIGREAEIIVEIHDDPDAGDTRWPGLFLRMNRVLAGFKPAADAIARYHGGLYFKARATAPLPDERYNTTVIQLSYCVRYTDRTSARGYQG